MEASLTSTRRAHSIFSSDAMSCTPSLLVGHRTMAPCISPLVAVLAFPIGRDAVVSRSDRVGVGAFLFNASVVSGSGLCGFLCRWLVRLFRRFVLCYG